MSCKRVHGRQLPAPAIHIKHIDVNRRRHTEGCFLFQKTNHIMVGLLTLLNLLTNLRTIQSTLKLSLSFRLPTKCSALPVTE